MIVSRRRAEYGLLAGTPAPQWIAACLSAMLLAISGAAWAQAAPERWGLTQEARISGHASGIAGLGYTLGLARASDGTLLVPQPAESVMRIFESAGRFLKLVGHPGDGPGEFRHIGRYGWTGDTLWVIDDARRRVSYFGPHGSFIGSESDTISSYGLHQTTLVAFLKGGRFLTATQPAIRSVEPLPDSAVGRLYVRDRSGTQARAILRTPLRGDVARVEYRGGPTLLAQPLADVPLVAVPPDGGQIVIVERPTPLSAAGEFTVRRITSDGRPLSSRRYTFDATRVQQGVLDSIVRTYAKVLANTRSAAEAEIAAAVRRAFLHPQWFPAFDKAVVGDDGTVWLRSLAAPTRWVVLDRDNTKVAEVRLPATAILGLVQRERIWVIERDADDIQSIVRYRLDRSSHP